MGALLVIGVIVLLIAFAVCSIKAVISALVWILGATCLLLIEIVLIRTIINFFKK